MLFLENNLKDVNKITLSTPEWAIRNHYFYSKAGFRRVGQKRLLPDGFLEFRYEKVLG